MKKKKTRKKKRKKKKKDDYIEYLMWAYFYGDKTAKETLP